MSPITSTAEFKVSLNRAHKIETRISSKLRELRMELSSTSVKSTFASKPQSEQVAALESKKLRAKELMTEIEELTAIRSNLRSIVGAKNAEVGVSSKLAEIEATQRLIQDYESLESSWAISPSEIPLHAVDEVNWEALPQGSSYRSLGSCTLTAVSKLDLEDILSRKAELVRNKYRLTDELSDLNSNRVDLAIPAHWATELGLV